MTPREIVLAQIGHRETQPVPYTVGFEGDVAERLDRYYGSKEWRARLQPFMSTRFGISTTREEPVSATHVRDVFGSLWRQDRRPWHLESPALPEPTFAGFEFPALDRFLDPVAPGKGAAIRKIREDREHFQVIGMGWGIFEQTWRIRGFENMLMDTVAEPAFYQELVERITDLYVGMVRFCADVPADAIMFGDDWGEQRGVILGPERWRRFLKPAWAKVYAEVHKQGKIVISHCCGSIVEILPDLIEIGLDVYESVQPEAAGMNPYGLKERFGDKMTFWGCLGSQSTMAFGTPEEVRAETRRLLTEMGKGGGYILAPAKALQPETPVENAAALVETVTSQ